MRGTIRHLQGKYDVISFRLIRLCDGDELRFYAFLKLHAIAKNSAFPGEATITAALGWERKKIFRQVKAMEAAGRLTVHRVPGRPNVYDITWYDTENAAGMAERIAPAGDNLAGSNPHPVPKVGRVPVPKVGRVTSPKNGTLTIRNVNEKEETIKRTGDKIIPRTYGRRSGGWSKIGDHLKKRRP
jgi:hypothetical protein